MDHVASNFALSTACPTPPADLVLSRDTPTSLVTVVIDEHMVRVSAPEPPPEDMFPEMSFEMATSFSVADDESADEGLQVSML
jgi:hypothetical protein